MVVTGTNGGSFCEDFGSIVLSQLTEAVTVEYTIDFYREGATLATDYLTEGYSPDSSGQVHINDLGKLAQSYFDCLPVSLDGADALHNYQVSFSMVAKDAAGSSLGSFSQIFYYSNCRTNIQSAYLYRGFLTRHRRTKVRTEQCVLLAFRHRDQSLYVGCSYKDGGTAVWSETLLQNIDNSNQLEVRNLNVSAIAEAFDVSESAVDFYIVYLKHDGEVIDAVQFDVDRQHAAALTHFAFYNCFGVPETLYFTGRDNRSAELEATYARILHDYRKINTNYNIHHEQNTGYISEVLRDCVEDLIHSDRVWIYDASGLKDLITITAVDMAESKPRSEPINVKFTYRLANECQRKVDRDSTVDYRIFDHTFGETFE